MAEEKPKILCVDDEPAVLSGIELHLRRKFRMSKANSGAEGLTMLEAQGPFPVVMSDMRMPGMDGATFLSAVRARAPESVRVLLTGQSDMDAAIKAVNEGGIFRFLTKPCPAEVLLVALGAALDQHNLVISERVLLQETLRGSVRALTEVLALTNPLAFGRATRAKEHVVALAARQAVPEAQRWPIEVAAMLSQLGTVTMLPQTVEKMYYGRPLTTAEETEVRRLPVVAEQLLAPIPRLEPVREILTHQDARFDPGTTTPAGPAAVKKGAALPLGARMLKLALDFDVLEAQGQTPRQALDAMRTRRGAYDPELLEAFAALAGGSGNEPVVQELAVSALRPGLVFVDDVRTRDGGLLIARGHEITQNLLERIRNFAKNVGVREPLKVVTKA
jgi:response regulator RpfG family c-di-GMP phosphodiesterase